jgi:diadenosine tetraphosphate (Ap4A) HIT family hydrolase
LVPSGAFALLFWTGILGVFNFDNGTSLYNKKSLSFIKVLMEQSMCLFCEMPPERVISENVLSYAVRDGFPVTSGHRLIIPKRHAVDYFSLTEAELLACHQLICSERSLALKDDPTIEGFNIGVNAGEVAGQTIFHCHFHLIPRRKGDVADPRGGIRHLIPGKGYYKD